MPCSWLWGTDALFVGACGAALAWTIRYCVRDAAASRQRPSAEYARTYLARRVLLQHARGLRAAQLCAGVFYAAIMSYVYLIVSPDKLTSAQIVGLLLSYLYVATTCWCTAIGLVPYFEKTLLEFNPVVSTVSVGSLALFTHFTGSTGLATYNGFLSKVLANDVLWVLEDCPLKAYLPLHLVLTLMHATGHLCAGSQWPVPYMALGYAGLGLILPCIVSGLLLPANSQAKVPGALHTALAATVMGYLLLDQLSRAAPLVEPLQDLAASGHSLLARGVVSLLDVPREGAKYSYGLPESTGLYLTWSTLVVLLMSALLAVISEGDITFVSGTASGSLLGSLSKNSAASALLAMLRGLSTPKKYAVLAMVTISLFQGVGIISVAAGLVMHGPETFVRSAPPVLLAFMIGVVLQVVGVLYVLVLGNSTDNGAVLTAAPGAASVETTAPATVAVSDTETISRSTSVGGVTTPLMMGKSMLTRANVMAQETLLDSSGGLGGGGATANGVDTYSMVSGLSRGASERTSFQDNADENAHDLRTRIEHLANFRTFMQGLDQQPGVYSLEDFIRGAATAMRGIFPGIAHASFCLLNSTRNCVNMYTFLGDGSRRPPRINVAVAPGTLIYHVLHNCQPVFINNVAAFPGPYADVQFMRFVLNLRSVACLPLVVAGSRVLGVLRLGFEDWWNWTEHEKSIAKQLALVLSSTSTGMGVNVSGMQPLARASYDSRDQSIAGVDSDGDATGKILHGVESGVSSTPSFSRPSDDAGMAYARTQPLGVPLNPQAVQYQAYGEGASGIGGLSMPLRTYGSNSGSGGAGRSGGSNAAGLMRRVRGPSRSALQYAGTSPTAGPGLGSGLALSGQPYPAMPGSLGGFDSGVQLGTTPTANTIPVGIHSHRSSMDYHAINGCGGGYYGNLSQGYPMAIGSMGDGGNVPGVFAQPGLGMPSARYVMESNDGIGGGGISGGGSGLYELRSNTSGAGIQVGPLMQSSSGSGQHIMGGEIDESWLLQQPGSSQVRRALAGQAQAQGAGGGGGADLKMLEVIGRGGFGSVYRGFWRGMTVAVKVLEHEDELLPCTGSSGSQSKVDTSSRRAALLEGAMTSTISHPHVVQTYDYRVVHLDPQSSLNGITRSRVLHETQIIMEFCDRGSLQDAIEQGVFVVDGPRGARVGTNDPEVDIELIIMTLAEVSAAMEYLHKHRITHRDLKPKNILLKTSNKDRRGYVSKVSDFGLSQVLPDTNKTQVSTKYSGTVTHMAPELIEDGKVYQQGDVYAFGIIMWEIYTSSTPYQSMAHPQIMVGVVTHNLRPKFPAKCPEWYKNLANRCWRKDPKTRPPFSEVTKALLAMLSDKNWSPTE